jgi:hypothetical protein
MIKEVYKNIIKKIVKMHSFVDVLECIIEVAIDEGLHNYKVGNEGAGENFYQIEEILCAAKNKIRQHDILISEQKANYNKDFEQGGVEQTGQQDSFKD